MTTPAPAPAPAAPAAVPGKVLGIVGLILAIVWPFQLLGLILSIVARVQSKNAGVKNTPATVGIIISVIILVGHDPVLRARRRRALQPVRRPRPRRPRRRTA